MNYYNYCRINGEVYTFDNITSWIEYDGCYLLCVSGVTYGCYDYPGIQQLQINKRYHDTIIWYKNTKYNMENFGKLFMVLGNEQLEQILEEL